MGVFMNYIMSWPESEIEALVSVLHDTIRMKKIFNSEVPTSKELSELGDIFNRRPTWENWYFYHNDEEELQHFLRELIKALVKKRRRNQMS